MGQTLCCCCCARRDPHQLEYDYSAITDGHHNHHSNIDHGKSPGRGYRPPSSFIVRNSIDEIENQNVMLVASTFCQISNEEYRWEDTPCLHMGKRENKCFFYITQRNNNLVGARFKMILTVLSRGVTCVIPLHNDRAMSIFKNALMKISNHPLLWEIKDVYYDLDKQKIALVKKYNPKGSLKDYIHRATNPKDNFNQEKYKTPGRQLPSKMIKKIGRHILEGLLVLREKGLIFDNLHTGNIILEDGKAKLAGIENTLLGLEPSGALDSLTCPLAGQVDIDILLFGHVLFEMAYGFEMTEPVPDFNKYIDLDIDFMIRQLLDIIFNPVISELMMEDYGKNNNSNSNNSNNSNSNSNNNSVNDGGLNDSMSNESFKMLHSDDSVNFYTIDNQSQNISGVNFFNNGNNNSSSGSSNSNSKKFNRLTIQELIQHPLFNDVSVSSQTIGKKQFNQKSTTDIAETEMIKRAVRANELRRQKRAQMYLELLYDYQQLVNSATTSSTENNSNNTNIRGSRSSNEIRLLGRNRKGSKRASFHANMKKRQRSGSALSQNGGVGSFSNMILEASRSNSFVNLDGSLHEEFNQMISRELEDNLVEESHPSSSDLGSSNSTARDSLNNSKGEKVGLDIFNGDLSSTKGNAQRFSKKIPSVASGS